MGGEEVGLIPFLNFLETVDVPGLILCCIGSLAISLSMSAFNGLMKVRTTAGIILLTTAFFLINDANTPEKNSSELEINPDFK